MEEASSFAFLFLIEFYYVEANHDEVEKQEQPVRQLQGDSKEPITCTSPFGHKTQ